MTPPKPLSPLEAPYPEGGHGDAEVLVELTVDRAGRVVVARVVRGDEPFGDAAVAASSTWSFAPATRASAPVQARIRAVITFRDAPARPPPPPLAAPGGEAPKPPTKAAPALEVNIHGEAPVPATATLSRAEVRLMPGAFGDPFRAIEAMPGVTPMASGVPYFYVRGAPPGNVGYFIDGIRVPILFHLGLGPSVVHPGIVERVDLYEGGYPAQFGRFAGAIVSGETRAPATVWHGEANVRLVDAGALVEAPFADGKAAALVGGRYGYETLLLKLIAPDVDLQYADYQARASYKLDAADRVSLFAFGSYDHWATREDGVFKTLFDTQFHRVDLRWDRDLGGGGTLRTASTLGVDRTALGEGRFVYDRMLAARTEVVRPISDKTTVRFGADVTLDAIETDLVRLGDDGAQASIDKLFPSRDDLAVGVHADVVLQLGSRLQLVPGARVDLFTSAGAFATGVDPRIAARLSLTKDVRFVQTHGLASQPPSFFLPGPGLAPALSGGLQRALQESAGFEFDLPLEIAATLGGFRNGFFNMTDPLSTVASSDHLPDSFQQRTDGQAYGLEIGVKRKLTSKLGGFFAYTLSRSTRWVGRHEVPSAFDRTHVLDGALSYDFGRGYRAGTRAVFYTGAPAVGVPSADLEHPTRLPPFFRLDVRLEKRWTLGHTGWISLVIEVLNATLTKESVAIDCGGDEVALPGSAQSCHTTAIGPVTIPSIGVEAGF